MRLSILPLKMPLRTRFVLYFTLLVMSLMALVIGVGEKHLRDHFFKASRKLGISIARNLAAVSIPHLLTYNYIAIKQNAEKASQQDDIAYIIILDKEGRVAAFSGHDEKEGKSLTSDTDSRAAQTPEILVKEIFFEEKRLRVMDVFVPVFVSGSTDRWGAIRIGLSLESMYKDITSMRFIFIFIGIVTIAIGWIGSFFLSRRITMPLEKLVKATVAVAKGDLEQSIEVSTGDEIEELAHNFNHMTGEVISHRKDLEERFREISTLKKYNDNILTSMSNGLLTLDLEGKVVTINRRGEDILGYSSFEVIGKRFEEVFGDTGELSYLVREGIEESKIFKNIEVSFLKGNEEAIISLTISFLHNVDGNRVGLLVVFDDITEMKALQEKMRDADRLAALGTVAATLAHDIKNPLSAISIFVQLLPRKGESESFRDRFNVTVSKEINRMKDIIENFLDLAKKPKLKLSSLDINILIRELIELYGPEMENRNITAEIKLSPDLLPVFGDQEYLRRAFSNLFLNAIQAMQIMPEGGDLFIETAPMIFSDGEESPLGVERVTKMVVKDTGIGMDSETVKNLFNPFYSTKAKGTGLGLVMVKKVVEEHKGIIEVESKLKKGSAFSIILPAFVECHLRANEETHYSNLAVNV